MLPSVIESSYLSDIIPSKETLPPCLYFNLFLLLLHALGIFNNDTFISTACRFFRTGTDIPAETPILRFALSTTSFLTVRQAKPYPATPRMFCTYSNTPKRSYKHQHAAKMSLSSFLPASFHNGQADRKISHDHAISESPSRKGAQSVHDGPTYPWINKSHFPIFSKILILSFNMLSRCTFSLLFSSLSPFVCVTS